MNRHGMSAEVVISDYTMANHGHFVLSGDSHLTIITLNKHS